MPAQMSPWWLQGLGILPEGATVEQGMQNLQQIMAPSPAELLGQAMMQAGKNPFQNPEIRKQVQGADASMVRQAVGQFVESGGQIGPTGEEVLLQLLGRKGTMDLIGGTGGVIRSPVPASNAQQAEPGMLDRFLEPKRALEQALGGR